MSGNSLYCLGLWLLCAELYARISYIFSNFMLVVYKPQTALSDGAGAATTMFHYLKRPLKRFLYKYLYNPESCFALLWCY